MSDGSIVSADWFSAAVVAFGIFVIAGALLYATRQPRIVADAFQDVFSAMASLKVLIVSLRDSALLAHAELAMLRATGHTGNQDASSELFAQITVDQATLTVPAHDVGRALKHMAEPVAGATIFAKIEYCSREHVPETPSSGGGND